jgi:hypothetical protein
MDGADPDRWSAVAAGWSQLWAGSARPVWTAVLDAAGAGASSRRRTRQDPGRPSAGRGWPAHPQRGFRGNEQVRRNWSQIFAGVPDLQARLPRMAVDGDTVWTEWDMSGTRRDGAAHLMRGVSIFGVSQGRLAWVRFYLEPVEETSGDVNANTRRLVGTSPAEAHTASAAS